MVTTMMNLARPFGTDKPDCWNRFIWLIAQVLEIAYKFRITNLVNLNRTNPDIITEQTPGFQRRRLLTGYFAQSG